MTLRDTRPGGRRTRKSQSSFDWTPEALSGAAREALDEQAAQAFLELATLTGSAKALADVQKAQLGILHQLFNPKCSYVAEYQPDRNELQVVSVRGRTDQRIAAAAPGKGPVGRAFANPSIVRESSLLAIPVLGAGGVLGCLVLLEPRTELSDPMALALGAQCAAGWDFARVRDDSARRNKDLQTAIAGLKNLEANREELLSNVSHDLKNPLTTIKAYLSMLTQGKQGPLQDKQLKSLQAAERNADRLLKMINDLLLMSRLQSGKMQLHERPFGLKALASEVMQLLAPAAEQAKVRLEMPRSPEVFVRGDRERIAEAIQNLLEHAIHRSPTDQSVEVAIAAGESQARILVRERGPAFTPDQLETLFQAFRRPQLGSGVRRAEAGLDLPLVAKIAQLHGGRVSARAVGSEIFYELVLPVFAAAVSPAESVAHPRAGDILLVEDDQDCREVLQEVLEAEGYRVQTSWQVAQARELLAATHPAMVLLDLRLAHEDGRSVLHHIRETPDLKDTAVFIISGASEVSSLAAGQGLDRIDGFFEKPIQLQRLLDAVAAVVRPARSQPRLV